MIFLLMVVRDEADIIRDCIDHHLRIGVDAIMVADNGSTDGTLDLLAEHPGVAHLSRKGDATFDQALWTGELLAHARARYGEGWVIPTDADEFVITEGGESLPDLLAGAPGRLLSVPRMQVVGARERLGGSAWRHELRFAAQHLGPPPAGHADPSVPLPVPFFCHDLPGKVVFRSEGFREIALGGHGVSLEGDPAPGPAPFAIAHYPVRAPYDFLRDTLRFVENAELKGGPATSGKYRRWAAMLAAGHSKDDILAEAMPDAEWLAAGLAAGTVRPAPTIDMVMRGL